MEVVDMAKKQESPPSQIANVRHKLWATFDRIRAHAGQPAAFACGRLIEDIAAFEQMLGSPLALGPRPAGGEAPADEVDEGESATVEVPDVAEPKKGHAKGK
jgi:hypothetical protein